MEAILANLLVPDGEIIKQATHQLRETLKRPDGIPQLCNCLATSQNVEVRQYASLLLRKRFGRRGVWMKMQLNDRQQVKQGKRKTMIGEIKLI